jgi:cobalamin biosynthesis protein CobW
VDEAALARVEAAIAEDRRPQARSIRVANGVLPADILLGQSAAAETDSANRQSHHELQGEEHEHDDFDSFVLVFPHRTAPPPRPVSRRRWLCREFSASRG